MRQLYPFLLALVIAIEVIAASAQTPNQLHRPWQTSSNAPTIRGQARKALQAPALPGRPPVVTLDQLLKNIDVSSSGPGDVRVEVGRPGSNMPDNSSAPDLPPIVVNVRISDLFPGRKMLRHPSSSVLPSDTTASTISKSHRQLQDSSNVPDSVQQALQAMSGSQHTTEVQPKVRHVGLSDLWCTDGSSGSSRCPKVAGGLNRKLAFIGHWRQAAGGRRLQAADVDDRDTIPGHLSAALNNMAGSDVSSVRTKHKKTELKEVTGGSSSSSSMASDGSTNTGNRRRLWGWSAAPQRSLLGVWNYSREALAAWAQPTSSNSVRATLELLNLNGHGHRRLLLQSAGDISSGSSNIQGSNAQYSSAGTSSSSSSSGGGGGGGYAAEPDAAVQQQLRDSLGVSRLWDTTPRPNLCQVNPYSQGC